MNSTGSTWLRPAPPLSIAAGLVLWGWQTQQLWLSLLMALPVESARLHHWKMELDSQDFNRVTDFTSLVMVLTIFYMFYNYGSPGIFEILASMPLVLYPMILTQQYSTVGTFNVSSLFISMRKLKDVDPYFVDERIDVGVPYLCICLVAASEGNQYPQVFFAVVFLIISWLLWGYRSRRYHPVVWVLVLFIAAGSAYAGQYGLRILQGKLETTYIDFFNRFHMSRRDADRQTTAIGRIGALKFSDRIVLRVDTDRKLRHPLYLAEASYNYYAYGTWTNIDRKPLVIDPEINGTSWLLSRPDNGNRQASITAYFSKDEAILPIPQGATGIHNLAAFQLERLNTDTIQVEIKPGWSTWDVNFHDYIVTASQPLHADLHIGQTYEQELGQLAINLGLNNLGRAQAVRVVENFFRENFRYSLIQKRRYPRGKYLTRFLFQDRRGHCEYFATATALLLRAANIPTRYVVGYSVDEYSDFENRYIARTRHAHSWVMAWVDDRWIRVDTTPSLWADMESEQQSSLQFIGDLWSWLMLKTDELGESEFFQELDFTWIIAALFGILALSVYRRKRGQSAGAGTKQDDVSATLHGNDSPLYDYLQQLEERGYSRASGETLLDWFIRISRELPLLENNTAVRLHNDYRFNPDSPVSVADIEKALVDVRPALDRIRND